MAGAGFEGPLWSAKKLEKVIQFANTQTDRQRIRKLRPLYSSVDRRESGPISVIGKLKMKIVRDLHVDSVEIRMASK